MTFSFSLSPVLLNPFSFSISSDFFAGLFICSRLGTDFVGDSLLGVAAVPCGREVRIGAGVWLGVVP